MKLIADSWLTAWFGGAMQVRVLGPFQLEEGGRGIPAGGSRQRAVLAQLVLYANQVVPSERLLVDLWGDDAPPSAANALQAAVSRLRRALPNGRLVTKTPGYLLRLLPQELDLTRFEQLLSQGREALAAGAAPEAARTLRQALSLWRGPVLADFRYEPFAQAEISRLEELRLTCIEERIEADLALGAGGALVGELQRIAAEHPLRERLRGQLMRALYRSGRQTEALDAYHELRLSLAEELGLEPSPALSELMTAILRHDSSLQAGSPSAHAVTPPARRPVTVLCVTLRVTTQSGRSLDPEGLDVVTGRVLAVVAGILERYGGKLTTVTSERMIGVFGVASLHEDDALRAARSTVEARDAVSVEATALEDKYGVRLQASFGVATAEALVGGPDPLGFAGDAVAQAIALSEQAEPAEIFISPVTHGLATAALDVERTGHNGFRLLSARVGVRPLPLRLDVPMVDREDELSQLEAAYANAVQRRSKVLVTIISEAGLGKTRLALELVARLSGEATTLTGRCLPYGESITFWPLRELVQQATAGCETQDGLQALLRGERDGPSIAERLHRALGSGNPGGSDSADIFWAVGRLLEVLAQHRPLVVILEDLHWAAPTFLDLVESIVLRHEHAPVMIICLSRPELLEQRPNWGAGAAIAVSIELAPLGDLSSRQLLNAFAGEQELAASTLARLLETAAGNPLYLEQLAGSLGDQQWSDVQPALPATIQALLAARLDRLGPGERAVLGCAAVIGKDFWTKAVAKLLPSGARSGLPRHLQTLSVKGLVQPERSDVKLGESYGFRHILIQQAAYRAVPKSLRAELHERFADWLEYVVRLPVDHQDEILGHHLEQSVRYRAELMPSKTDALGLAVRASQHLETAGHSAYSRGDALAAVNLLERADALLAQSEVRRARLLTGLGAALSEVGELDRARDELGTAQLLASTSGDDTLLAHARVRALLLGVQVDLNQATASINQEVPALRTTFERSSDHLGLCQVSQLEAAMHWNEAQSAAAEAAWQQAAAHARRASDHRYLTETLGWLASAALWGPTPAPEGIRQCEAYLFEVGDIPANQPVILLHLSGLYAMRDDVVKAETLVRRAERILDNLGNTMTAAITEPAAFVAMLTGRADEAEARLRLDYESLSRMGEKTHLATTAALLAQAIAYQGHHRHDEAERLISISRDQIDQDLSARIISDAVLARILASRNQFDEAEALARSAVALAERTDLTNQRGDTLLDLAEVQHVTGNDSEANAAARQALALYRSKANLPAARRALRELAHYSSN